MQGDPNEYSYPESIVDFRLLDHYKESIEDLGQVRMARPQKSFLLASRISSLSRCPSPGGFRVRIVSSQKSRHTAASGPPTSHLRGATDAAPGVSVRVGRFIDGHRPRDPFKRQGRRGVPLQGVRHLIDPVPARN